MNDLTGDVMVPMYFIVAALALFYLAMQFYGKKPAIMKNFGLGLGLYSLAMAVWAVVVITKPADIGTWTTVGAVPYGLAHLFFLRAAIDKFDAAKKSFIFMGAAAYLAVLFLVRTFVYESSPAFSENGLFYFNADPVVVALYIGAFAMSVLPAINAVSKKIKDKTVRFVTQVSFTTLVLGSVVLVTSYDDTLQLINGWIMGTAFVLLVIVYAKRTIK